MVEVISIFRIAEMFLFKGALKHTFSHLKRDTNKKTASNNRITEPPYTLCTLIDLWRK